MNTHILTDWFPANEEPAYPGVYEKEFYFTESSMYQYWDGTRWYYGADSPEKTYKEYEQSLIDGYIEPLPRRWRGINTGWFLVKDYQPLYNGVYRVFTPEYFGNIYSRFENGVWYMCSAEKSLAASYLSESTDMLVRGAMFKIHDDGQCHTEQAKRMFELGVYPK